MHGVIVSDLGKVLLERLPAIEERAMAALASEEGALDSEMRDALRTLCDRLALSLTFSKSLGLRSWAETQARRHGRLRAVDLVIAAADALVGEAEASGAASDEMQSLIDMVRGELLDAVLLEDARPTREVMPLGAEEAKTALLVALGERDPQMRESALEGVEWARRLGVAMGLGRSDVAFLETAALLRDVGKLAVPDDLLFKRGPLTLPEWRLMREHAAAGARILDRIPSLSRWSLVVRAHHERYDGHGYPDGLEGEAIPFEARVVAVIDAFQAMITPRVYRPALPPREALKHLCAGRGTRWDPMIVEALCDVVAGERHGVLSADRRSEGFAREGFSPGSTSYR